MSSWKNVNLYIFQSKHRLGTRVEDRSGRLKGIRNHHSPLIFAETEDPCRKRIPTNVLNEAGCRLGRG